MIAARVFTVLALFAGSALAAPVPSTVNFTARLVDDKGAVVTGEHRVSFALFAAETGGTAVWTEDATIDVEEGLVFHDLGTTKPLDGAILDGRKLFLEVAIDADILEPRVALGSVPYAVRSTEAVNAQTVGGVAVDALQKRITGSCGSGNFIIGIGDDGAVACAPDLSGTGDITDVIAANGLQGGGTSGSVTLSLVNCGQNQVLKFQGSVWACAPDADSGGDITSVGVGAGGGLTGGGTTGDVTLSMIPCAANQILRFNGAWACSNDIDTNSGGTITGISTSGNSGLVGGTTAGNATLSLLTSCGNNQVLKFNTATTAWGCANDNDTNSGGDLTDIIGGAGLTVTNGSGPSPQLDIGQGTGILVAADSVSLDVSFTDNRYDNRYDPRYVNTTGDTMSGLLNMGGSQITNRGCPAGYLLHGPGLCLEDIDDGNMTFAQCTNKCRAEGTHVCSAGEMRAVVQSGIPIGNGGTLGDWVDNLESTTNALFISDAAGTLFGTQALTLTAFCRCCADVE